MVRVGGLAYTCTPSETVGKRISELKLDNGHALEAGKSYKVAGWASVNEQSGAPVWDVVAKHLRVGQAAQPAAAGRHAERRRGQSGHCGTGMTGFSTIVRADDRGAADRSRRAGRPRPAGAAAGQAVCRAQDRAAALRQRPAQAGPRAQRRQQSDEVLRPRQGRDRDRGVRSRHRAAAPGKSQPQDGREPGRAGRALRHLPQHRRYARAREPASGRNSSRRRRRCRSASRRFCF